MAETRESVSKSRTDSLGRRNVTVGWKARVSRRRCALHVVQYLAMLPGTVTWLGVNFPNTPRGDAGRPCPR